MNKCPVCKEPLFVTEYEGQRVRQCSRCEGSLVPKNRLAFIKNMDLLTKQELKAGARRFRGSTRQRLKCPRCYALMHKQRVRLPV